MKGQSIPERLRSLSETGMSGPVITLVSGTLAAQVIVYAARPLLTRLFTPEAFGIFGFYLAVVTIIAIAASGKYEDAIPVASTSRRAACTLVLAVGLGGLVSAATLLLVPFGGAVAGAIGRPEVATALMVVPLGVLATTWGRSAELWLTRVRRFRPISGSRLTDSLVTVPVQIGFGAAGGAALGLVGGHLAGRSIASIGLAAASLRTPAGDLRALIPTLRADELWRVAGRYRRFPLFSMPSGFLNNLSSQLPLLLLLTLFAPAIAGLYAVAYATLAAPTRLIGASVGQVFFSHAPDARREGRLGQLTAAVFTRLSALGLFPLGAVAIAGPAAFSLVFGAEWREAGVYAQYLTPWMLFVFLSAPLSNLFDVLERQHWELAFNGGLAAARAAAIVVGAALGDARLAVWLFAAVSAVFWAGHTVLMLSWGSFPLRVAGARLLRHLALVAVPLALLGAVQLAGAADGLIIAAMVGTGVLAVMILARFEHDLLPPAPR